MSTLERNLERRFREEVARRGGWAIKFTGLAGLPDRLVIWPGGRIDFVELKTETGRVSKIQRAVHRKLTNLGVTVEVLHGREQIDEYLDNH